METLILALNQSGYDMHVLTTCAIGDFHLELKKHNIKVFTNFIKKSWYPIYWFKQLYYLVSFCKNHKIQVVHSHLQEANLIAVFAQYFIRARVIIFRHHFEAYNVPGASFNKNNNERIGEKIISKLAKKIIVPSSGVYEGMRLVEKVNMTKVAIVPYVYNFGQYSKPDTQQVKLIKKRFDTKLLMIMCARLIPAKRHDLVFRVIEKLVKEGYDVKLLVLDVGSEEKRLKNFIRDKKLGDHIFMLGFRRDFINYMAASDILIHPSIIEASNSAVKEMGLLKKIVVVCSGIGDFNDYIEDRENGFLLNLNETSSDLEEVIKEVYIDSNRFREFGERLYLSIMDKFSLGNQSLQKYVKLIN